MRKRDPFHDRGPREKPASSKEHPGNMSHQLHLGIFFMEPNDCLGWVSENRRKEEKFRGKD